MSTLLTTSEVARLISESPLIGGTVAEHHIRRLYERGDLPEPPKLGGRRAVSRDDLPQIVAACRRRGWLPSHESEATRCT
jgi:hypothetical protein